MKQTFLIQTLACGSGLAGIYLADSSEFRWILAALIVLSAAAAVAIAWSESESKAFVERALESLILSSKPNEMARKRVISAINAQGSERGLPITQLLSFSNGTTQFRFFKDDHTEVGVLLVNDEMISRFAVMPDREIKKATEKLFLDRNGKDIRNRDQIVEAVSGTAQTTVWEANIRTPEWCMWVNDKLISAPTSPPDQTCPEEHRLTFKASEFDRLSKMSDFALHTMVHEKTKELLMETSA